MAQTKKHYTAKERALFQSARQGDREAINALILQNQGLIHYVLRKWLQYDKIQGLEYDDMFQSGVLGLERAIRSFDLNLGNRFSTYAFFWIRQAIQGEIYNQARIIRNPVHFYEQQRCVTKAINELTNSLKRHPTTEEIAQYLDMPKDRIEMLRISFLPTASLDKPLKKDDSSSRELGDMISNQQAENPEKQAETAEFHQALQKALTVLGSRECQIIKMRYGLEPYTREHTLEEVGNELNLSRERIRQISSEALRKLAAKNQSLKKWLEEPVIPDA